MSYVTSIGSSFFMMFEFTIMIEKDRVCSKLIRNILTVKQLSISPTPFMFLILFQ